MRSDYLRINFLLELLYRQDEHRLTLQLITIWMLRIDDIPRLATLVEKADYNKMSSAMIVTFMKQSSSLRYWSVYKEKLNLSIDILKSRNDNTSALQYIKTHS
jgi:hypothetical protein